jgi:hypothetical protein
MGNGEWTFICRLLETWSSRTRDCTTAGDGIRIRMNTSVIYKQSSFRNVMAVEWQTAWDLSMLSSFQVLTNSGPSNVVITGRFFSLLAVLRRDLKFRPFTANCGGQRVEVNHENL